MKIGGEFRANDPDPQVRQAAIAGLEQLASLRDEQFVSRLLDMVHDPDVDVCVQVLSVLARSGDFYQMASAVEVLDQLLTSEDPLHRVLGVRVLGRIGDERAARALLEHLFDSTDQVRLAAAVAIETFPLDGMPEELVASIVEGMSGLLHDPVERIRQAAVVRLGRDGSRKLYTALVGALADSSDQVRTKAVDVLTRVGKAIVPVVHTGLQSKDRQLRTMATVVLSRVSPEEFGSLIVGTNITGNLLAIYHNYGLIVALERCDAYRGIGVLQSALYEQNQQLLDEIFYLLTAVRDPAAVKIVSESLRSETARIRANATEALESLTTPQVARLTAPLFEPDLPLSELLSLSEEVWEMQHPDTVEAIQQILNDPDDSEFRMIAAYVLGEMGAALIPPGEMPTATAPEPVKDKDAGRLGLLAELTGKLEAQGGAAELKPTGRPRRSPPADLFGALIDTPVEESRQEALEPQPARETPFTLQEIEEIVDVALQDADRDVRLAAQAAKRLMAGRRITDIAKEEEILLSTIERIIFLKEVPFFQGMTVDQLRVLASVCEEELFEEDTRIFNEGDSGGVLYVVVNGRVGIEQEKRSGSFARLATIEAHSYFGEVNLFDNSPRTTSAVAIRDTLTLRLRREPLIALARQYPDLSLELINVLSERLREADDRVAELTRTRPRELHKLFDQYE